MHATRYFLALAGIVAALVVLSGLTAMRRPAPAVPVAAITPPPATEVAPAAPPVFAPTTAPSPTPVPSPTALRPMVPLAPISPPAETPSPVPAVTPEPPSAPVGVASSARVDQAGPIALPTVAPLPVGEGRPPIRLRIPALGLDTPVLPMGWHVVADAEGLRSEWDLVDDAAGHHLDSVYPGEAGNVVLSGHNNIGGAVFRSVCVIGEPGVAFGLGDAMVLVDEVGREFTYRVNGWHRFPEANVSLAQRQENARYMAPTEHAQLTLITCWPPTSNTHRVVVTGLLTAMSAP
ncbi:MAG: sortase [Anaerolineae bacterium]|nr:sortase [Caldilineales bacterium]MCX7852283.1 sortase [Caldilineales bacterium]MDW8269651.1 sortase [Anaerolineae bacterium]